jgi:uncharacterized membrane protein
MKLNPLLLGTAAALLLAVLGSSPWPGFGLGPWLDRICLALAFAAFGFGCGRWLLSRSKHAVSDSESEPIPPEIVILRERYARGEIDREHYLQSLDDLKL